MLGKSTKKRKLLRNDNKMGEFLGFDIKRKEKFKYVTYRIHIIL